MFDYLYTHEITHWCFISVFRIVTMLMKVEYITLRGGDLIKVLNT
jgi:hypothetical protein